MLIERGSTRSHCVENWLWLRLWYRRIKIKMKENHKIETKNNYAL